LPIEWLLPPILVAFQLAQFEVECLPVRLVGFAVGVGGATVLVWSCLCLERQLIHEAALLDNHTLVTIGPYRFIRHPIYTGYLALLLGSGIATFNWGLLLIWPISLVGIRIQAESEERLLASRFGTEYSNFASHTGRFLPRLRARAPD
jgi:protein-S-isoprenylcysteine O-methyltransferase Ste14